ncbi:MAG: hypothetical protein HY286_08135 [Planctomycetes bacterium]|nr:hypothetical protein [Planctomycetota bacterium]
MSSFFAKKLDSSPGRRDLARMKPKATPQPPKRRRTAAVVRERIGRHGARLWQLADFRDLPFLAVAQALSRLTRDGMLERLSKGVYYRGTHTSLGRSRPNPAAIEALASRGKSIFPSGTSAANSLGFTTQNPAHPEISTSDMSLPKKLIGPEARVHTRRPPAWKGISGFEAAMLEFLRRRGRDSELSPNKTIGRTLQLLAKDNCYDRLLAIAGTEPPRVRALLGALGEELKQSSMKLRRLRSSLNPYSRFDFGLFAHLSKAPLWNAKR